ncbi:tRNA (guanosine(37)-N1)-methyltransferase TrmD [Natronogracilivirga saccharolytica]|uniref:tRNA (guanine-N(1)-)-methyltransferase n=1 Tax=Natronogracilivirga saccharolytica TaxID=2812953 RepID=A0A8J7UUK5_9BACT|nr:tRNA (guanosine(37)-N1)-methyltransferase TrmD [Natronogracilivirga saccharolytica]MBP3191551.1 tRNA (guanosine(37)-N1)-methyltransferase TrmD [Natronogracilivirga saccharolytica]
MRIDIISAVPELLSGPLDYSIVGRARKAGHVEVVIHDLRSYTTDKHGKVDDYPYGGGAGLVMTPQPIFDCIQSLQKQRAYDEVIFPTPDAPVIEQQKVNELTLLNNIILLCGHYKGVDQRVRDELVTLEVSIGDYVLSGGELPAMVLVDGIVRLLPGVLGDAESALDDSFQDGLLSPPVYTRPANFRGNTIPEVLTSGNHNEIRKWREQKAIELSKKVRPDLYNKFINKS